MTIFGTGVDLVDMRRIQKIINTHGQRFVDRIFTPYEQSYCKKKNQHLIRSFDETSLCTNSFAKMFAAKEATLKAIGNTENIQWHDIEVCHEDSGRPFIKLSGMAQTNLLQALQQTLVSKEENFYIRYKVHLSMADDIPYGIASVIIEYKECIK